MVRGSVRPARVGTFGPLTCPERPVSMLNMSSAITPPEAARATTAGHDPDVTARARIRDAAIARFGAQGIRATSLRAIADDAGVSAPLVVHHFGSKSGLRRACDQHVAATIRAQKQAAMAAGTQVDVLGTLQQAQRSIPALMRYLGRSLTDTTPEVADLVDELVEDAIAYLQEGIRNGLLTPSDDLRGRASVMVIWSLGAVVLNDHLQRLVGADLTGDTGSWGGYALPALEIMGAGVIAPDYYRQLREGYEAALSDLPSPAARDGDGPDDNAT
jgi:AcrR family transcriptional regulator